VTRPTLDRVRQAIFNALDARDLTKGAVVLDLFAGSGALSMEALSRGAHSATLVESDRRAVESIRENAVSLGFLAQTTIIRSDVSRWLTGGSALSLAPTLVVADPPYEWTEWDVVLANLPASVRCLVAESGSPLGEKAGWESIREQRYGGTVVTMLIPTTTPIPDPSENSSENEDVR
jgi:16S rRNA (guanine966-N2)-methyltransferase